MTLEEWAKAIIESLQPLNDELANRGTKFFGGNKPNMVDYMLWPWAERAGSIALKLGSKLPFSDSDIPVLRQWRKDMRQGPVASDLYLGPEVFWKVAQWKLQNTVPDYDSVLSS